jgi:putative transposase
MLWELLKREGFDVNHKRVERLYKLEGLSLRTKKRKKKVRHLREALPVPEHSQDVWSMDFVFDELVNCRRFKCLTIIDHCTRESPAIHVDTSIRGVHVVEVLERLRLEGKKPQVIVMDNGSEFTSKALAAWASKHNVRLFFIEPGKPTQNAFIESFNGKFRNECLDQHWFSTVHEARLIIETYRKEYETERPHSSLGGLTPKEFAQTIQNELNKTSTSIQSFSLVQ